MGVPSPRHRHLLLAVLAACACPPAVQAQAGVSLVAPSPSPREGATYAANATCVLNAPPTADVVLRFTSSDLAEGGPTADSGSLTFTPVNWNVVQTVTVTAVDDGFDDDGKTWTLNAFASAPGDTAGYDALPSPAATVAIANADDDAREVSYSLLEPSEGQVDDGILWFVLRSEPTAPVTVDLTAANAAEGFITSTALSLTFDPATWQTTQSVVLHAVDDDVNDDDAQWTVTAAISAAGETTGYDTLPPMQIAIKNNDDEVAFVDSTVVRTPREDGQADGQVAYVLTSLPSGNVTVELTSAEVDQGRLVGGMVTLVFTPATWDIPQTVDIVAVDDLVDDPPGRTWDVAARVMAVGESTGYATLPSPLGTPVENVDDDTADVYVAAPTFPRTAEAAPTQTFNVEVKLATEPLAPVTITATPADATAPPRPEATASAPLTFTAATWNATQTLQVAGADEAFADGDTTYTVVLAVGAAGDVMYDGFALQELTAVNEDDDVLGIAVVEEVGSPAEGDPLSKALFSVVLRSMPTADVTIALTNTAPAEGTIESPPSLTFTRADWSVEQTVTLAAVDERVDDDGATWAVTGVAAAPGELTGYDGAAVSEMRVTNVNDDVAAVNIAVAGGGAAVTSEAGGTFEVAVVLRTEPVAAVTIAASIPAATDPYREEATVGDAALVFTAANWRAVQTMTVTGVDDAFAEGDTAYGVAFVATGDATYAALVLAGVPAVNTDDDVAGVAVGALSAQPEEGGGGGEFTLVLTSRPTADVTIQLSSSDAGEGGPASAAAVVFTTVDWAVPKTTTVTAVDDAVDDDGKSWNLQTTASAPTETTGYDGIYVDDIVVTAVDNDAAGVDVATPAGAQTDEGGSAFPVAVVLRSEPVAAVTITVATTAAAEGDAGGAALTFTPADWSVGQTVSVTGVDDAADDGDVAYEVTFAVTGDAKYAGLAVAAVAAVNVDDDDAGVTAAPLAQQPEEGGDGGAFTVVLDSQPTAAVTVAAATSDPAEGAVVGGAILVFAPDTWAVPQSVSVSAVDDAVDDDGRTWQVVLSVTATTDTTGYAALASANVTVVNVDNDAAGIVVDPLQLAVTEPGSSAGFTVVLNSQPTSPITVELASSDPSVAAVEPAALTFTPAGAAPWNRPQAATLTARDNNIADGTRPLDVAVAVGGATADAVYTALQQVVVAATCADDDVRGVTIDAAARKGIAVDEAPTGATSATYTVVLESEPLADVTVSVVASDASEGAVGGAVVFPPAAWSVAQTVTVNAVDDDVVDGNVAWELRHVVASGDAGYEGIRVEDLVVRTMDDDVAGFAVAPLAPRESAVPLQESGDAKDVTVVLESMPVASVVVPVSTSDPTECRTSVDRLLFPPAAWAVPQTVVVTAVDDAQADGAQECVLVLGRTTSADPTYHTVDPPDVFFSVVDDDTAALEVSTPRDPSAALPDGSTSEAGGVAEFTVALATEPTALVLVTLNVSYPREASVTAPLRPLTFKPSDWAAPQAVQVTGLDDNVADGDTPYTVLLSVASAGDAAYAAVVPVSVPLVNIDDGDAAGFALSAPSGPTSEAGTAATITVVLTSRPTAEVVVLLSCDTGEGALVIPQLRFPPAQWAVPQTATVVGVRDYAVDGDATHDVVARALSAADAAYTALPEQRVAITNTDVDVAGVDVKLVGAAGYLTTNESSNPRGLFTVALQSKPVGPVTLLFVSSNVDEGVLLPSEAVFGPSDWRTPQTLVVQGVNDDVDDGDVMFEVRGSLAGAVRGSGYSNVAIAPVVVVNADDDESGFVVSEMQGATHKGGGTATFTVAMKSQPLADVTLPMSASSEEDVALSTSRLIFTKVTWRTPQTVTVTGLDGGAGGDVEYSVAFGSATTVDPTYDGRRPAAGAVAGVNSDAPGGGGMPTVWIIVIALALVIFLCVFCAWVRMRSERGEEARWMAAATERAAGGATHLEPIAATTPMARSMHALASVEMVEDRSHMSHVSDADESSHDAAQGRSITPAVLPQAMLSPSEVEKSTRSPSPDVASPLALDRSFGRGMGRGRTSLGYGPLGMHRHRRLRSSTQSHPFGSPYAPVHPDAVATAAPAPRRATPTPASPGTPRSEVPMDSPYW